jgi:hypothetical protein
VDALLLTRLAESRGVHSHSTYLDRNCRWNDLSGVERIGYGHIHECEGRIFAIWPDNDIYAVSQCLRLCDASVGPLQDDQQVTVTEWETHLQSRMLIPAEGSRI